MRRVVQVSALGAEPEAGAAYADSKRRADEYLMCLDLDLRPALRSMLGMFWLATGLIALWSAGAATDLLVRAGLGDWSNAALLATAALDVALGMTLLLRIFARPVMAAQLAVTLAYLRLTAERQAACCATVGASPARVVRTM